MTMAVGAAALLLALLCAAIMGLAIQRGGTCTVAAMDELLAMGRPTRLMAMIEAALWVGGGLLLARGAGFVTALPAGFALTGWTLAGAACWVWVPFSTGPASSAALPGWVLAT